MADDLDLSKVYLEGGVVDEAARAEYRKKAAAARRWNERLARLAEEEPEGADELWFHQRRIDLAAVAEAERISAPGYVKRKIVKLSAEEKLARDRVAGEKRALKAAERAQREALRALAAEKRELVRAERKARKAAAMKERQRKALKRKKTRELKAKKKDGAG